MGPGAGGESEPRASETKPPRVHVCAQLRRRRRRVVGCFGSRCYESSRRLPQTSIIPSPVCHGAITDDPKPAIPPRNAAPTHLCGNNVLSVHDRKLVGGWSEASGPAVVVGQVVVTARVTPCRVGRHECGTALRVPSVDMSIVRIRFDGIGTSEPQSL